MSTTITPTTLERPELPDLVQTFLDRTLPDAASPPERVRLVQNGRMQLKPDGRPLTFRAVEELSVTDVAFTWQARLRVAPLLDMHVLDRFAGGKGGLRATLIGLPVTWASGEETSVGEAMRYLAELPWVPQAIAANPHLRWKAIDPSIVDVAVTVGSATASVGLRFDQQGDVIAAFGHRPHREGRKTELRHWVGLYSDYAELGGVRIPTRAEVRWDLPDGPFVYFRAEITEFGAAA